MAKTGRESVQQMLRLPDDLRESLREASEANGRSLNAEIVQRLEKSFAGGDYAERVKSLEVENAHLKELYALEARSRRIGDKLTHHAQALLHIYSDMIRRYAEGDETAIIDFAEHAKLNPDLGNFPMPEPLEDEPEEDN
jgi:cobalamin biosynthesis protein CobT